MIDSFYMNGYIWKVRFVEPNNPILIDRTGVLTVAVTNPADKTVYLNKNLSGEFLNRVFIHELGHCTMFSYGLVSELHRMVKKRFWIEAEEWMCNFIADYGGMIFSIAKDVLGRRFISVIPYAMERLIA